MPGKDILWWWWPLSLWCLSESKLPVRSTIFLLATTGAGSGRSSCVCVYGGAESSESTSSTDEAYENTRSELPEALGLILDRFGESRRPVAFFLRFCTWFSSELVDALKKLATRCGMVRDWMSDDDGTLF